MRTFMHKLKKFAFAGQLQFPASLGYFFNISMYYFIFSELISLLTVALQGIHTQL